MSYKQFVQKTHNSVVKTPNAVPSFGHVMKVITGANATHTPEDLGIYIYIYVLVYISMYIFMYIFMYISMYISMYVCICVCIYVLIYVAIDDASVIFF